MKTTRYFLIIVFLLVVFSCGCMKTELNQTTSDRDNTDNLLKVDVLKEKSISSFQHGNYNESLSYLDDALNIDPDNVDLLNQKGVVLMYSGYDYWLNGSDDSDARYDYYTKSGEYFDKALSINPNFTEAWNNKGVLGQLEYRNIRNSLSYYEKALEIDPNYTPAMINKGFVILEIWGMFSPLGIKNDGFNEPMDNVADALFIRAVTLEPDNPVALYARSYAPGGEGSYSKAVSLDPELGKRRNLTRIVYLKYIMRHSRVTDCSYYDSPTSSTYVTTCRYIPKEFPFEMRENVS